MRLMAFDPGRTTGVSENPGTSWQHAFTHAQLYRAIKTYRPSILVYESFHFANRQDGADYYAIEMIGIINLYAEEYLVPVIGQNRGIKPYWTREKLTRLGLWLPGKTHAMDALRHRLAYEVENNMFDLQLLKH